jgi:hypothetical protein
MGWSISHIGGEHPFQVLQCYRWKEVDRARGTLDEAAQARRKVLFWVADFLAKLSEEAAEALLAHRDRLEWKSDPTLMVALRTEIQDLFLNTWLRAGEPGVELLVHG